MGMGSPSSFALRSRAAKRVAQIGSGKRASVGPAAFYSPNGADFQRLRYRFKCDISPTGGRALRMWLKPKIAFEDRSDFVSTMIASVPT